MENFSEKTAVIWSIADILRGGWKRHEYQDVILPLVVLKRLDSILADTKQKVLEKYNEYKGKVSDLDPILKRASGTAFYNTSAYDFKSLLGEPGLLKKNFKAYLNGYSQNIQDIFEKFNFATQLERLEGGNLLFLIIEELNKVDLHPRTVDNYAMGHVFEELLRKFSEMSNETAGEHYTPRDVISLMAELLLEPDTADLKRPHVIKKIYDPACGTGGMLTVAKDYILEHINPKADIYLYGQELNSVTYAMAKSDMLIKGENPDLIRGGEKDTTKASTLSNDQFFGDSFDYCLSNPPYGVDWKKDKDAVDREASRGYAGRFGAGLPRISDGQLLFLQHLVSKMKPEKDGGSRIAIVHNGSPLFTGDAGSGESEIRRWILEKDLLETIVALPDQLFYNTGINTYLWFVTNRKSKERKGKVQLIDGRAFFKKTRKSLGSKRHEIDEPSKQRIFKLYGEFKDSEYSKIFNTTDFAYRQIQVERPLRLKFDMTGEKIIALREALDIDLKKTLNKVVKKKTEDAEVPLKIMAAIVSLKDRKWGNREAFVGDILKAFEKEVIKSGQKILKTIVDTVGERDENADICLDADGKPEADSELRDHENVPWGTDVREYFEREVKPYVADAWINESVVDHKDSKVGIVGYEIPFTRYFYKYEAPRSLGVIEADIENIENELRALREKRSALITHAVTKGLNPKIKLVESGLPWIDAIPENWELRPNKSFLKKRKRLVGSRYSDFPLLSLTRQGVIVRDVESGKGKFSEDMSTFQVVEPGNLIFCLFDIKETPRTVGLSNAHGMITGAYTVFECPDPILARFIEYFYIAMDDKKSLSYLYSGLRNTIAPPRFLRIPTPIPPSEIQKEIVDYLDEQTSLITDMLEKIEKSIGLLQEFKSSLVSHVVRGKIKIN